MDGPRSVRGRLGAALVGSDGFTITEAVAAVLIVGLFTAASAATVMSGYRTLRETKYLQQATALGNHAIEGARDVSYDSLAMLNSDLAGDPDVLSSCPGLTGPGNFFDPDGAGPLECERIVSADGGVDITDHIQTVTVEGKPFTVRRYVTWVDDEVQGGPGESYKRVSVIVDWDADGETKVFETSTFVTRARRGLPVPDFRLTPASQTKQVEAGATVVFPHSIQNVGIIDAYDITMAVPSGWAVAFYSDAGEIGVYEPTLDLPLADTNGTGTVDTGNVATDAVVYFLAVVAVPAGQSNGLQNLPLTATSGANSDVSRVAQDKAQVAPAGLTLYLHNRPTPPTGDTSAQSNLDMNTTQPTATTLYKYSGLIYTAHPGRYVDKASPLATQFLTQYMANWVYQVPTATVYNGTGQVRLWIAAKDLTCDKTLNLRFYVRQKTTATTSTGTTLAQADATVPAGGGSPPCNFAPVTIPFTMNATVPTNRYVELKVVVNSTSGDAALLAYDTVAHPSTMFLPQVATP